MSSSSLPSLSIIIPAYNAERYIESAVASALLQEGIEVEVIVIDDGSTDSTHDLLTMYRNLGVRVERQENQGPAAARNKGVSLAAGEFVGFLDADDMLLPRWGRCLVAELNRGIQIAVSDAFVFGGTRNPSDSPLLYYSNLNFPSPDKQQIDVLAENFVISTACLRKDLVLAAGGFDIRYRGVADWDLWIRIILANGKAAKHDEPLSLYRRGHGSMSSNVRAMKQEEIRLLEALARQSLSPDQESARSRTLIYRQALLDALIARDGKASERRRVAVTIGRKALAARSFSLMREAISLLVSAPGEDSST
jgi:glycosyltransferase involved in cell wall biosynthesis